MVSGGSSGRKATWSRQEGPGWVELDLTAQKRTGACRENNSRFQDGEKGEYFVGMVLGTNLY